MIKIYRSYNLNRIFLIFALNVLNFTSRQTMQKSCSTSSFICIILWCTPYTKEAVSRYVAIYTHIKMYPLYLTRLIFCCAHFWSRLAAVQSLYGLVANFYGNIHCGFAILNVAALAVLVVATLLLVRKS